MWKSGISEEAIKRLSRINKISQYDEKLPPEEDESSADFDATVGDTEWANSYSPQKELENEKLAFGVTHQTVRITEVIGSSTFVRTGTTWEAYSRDYEDDYRDAVTLWVDDKAVFIVPMEELKKISEAS